MNESKAANKSPSRSTKDGPWCWQSKPARKLIRDAFDATHDVATALSVYDALTEISSDEESATFTTTHAHIQKRSGVSTATIKKHLGVLGELKLVRITTPALRAPCTYTLLPIANGWLALANVTQNGPLARSEEGSKKYEEGTKKTMSSLAVPAPEQSVDFDSLLAELETKAEADGHADEFAKWIALNKRKGWRQENKATGKMEPIKSPRASFAAFIEHISAENQCSREKSARPRSGAKKANEHTGAW